MKRFLIFIVIMATAALRTVAQQYDENQKIKLWDNSTAPHTNELSGDESVDDMLRVGNISSAELYVYYAPKEKATGQAVLICPGGGYQIVALGHEGLQVAKWLADNGITAAVLKYRMPNGHYEVPLEDATEALRVVRELADEHNFSAQKVGVMGFSAGGHLAASLSNLVDDSQKPNFSILMYPVITATQSATHSGSYQSLLGENLSEELLAKFSLEKQVTGSTPSTFLALSDDDNVVPPMSSICYYEALKSAGISASLHIYPVGGHGWGMFDSFKYKKEWQSALLDWLSNL